MMNLLRRALKFLAYFGAGVVILLAIVVGLFRLFLPRLPEYQEEIKIWASTEIGVDVNFTGMDARWGLSGPELKFYNAELLRQDTMVRLVAAEEVSVGVSLMRLIKDGALNVDRVVVRDTRIEVRQLESGQWMIQGSLIEDLKVLQQGTGREIGEIEVLGQDIELLLVQPGEQRPRRIDISRLDVRSDSTRLAVDALVNLPDEFGGRVTLAATQLLAPPVEERSWDIDIEAGELRLAGLSRLHDTEFAQFSSGSGSINLSLEFSGGDVDSATADFDFEEILHEEGVVFDLGGRLEFNQDTEGWLLAADDVRLTTPSGAWPESSFHVETSIGRDGQVIMLNVRASHVNLSDGVLLEPWLNERQNELRLQLDASGVIRNLNATLSDVDTETPRYDISVDLDQAGVAAYEKFPGVRGFSGNLRADRAGGLLAIDSQDTSISLPNLLAQTLDFDTATGTVIWRRSGNRTTFLSDHIEIRNSVIDSDTNVELTFIDGGGAPVIDLDSTWSISDISAARQYLPQKIMKPKLYDWLNQALIAGEIPRGKTRLYGPLDKFPFDNDEGRLLIDANIRDAKLLYHPDWPVAELIELEVGLENLRLFSKRSRTVNAGNEVVDAKVEIGDFRAPILTVEGFATGELETIRQFAMQSPIGLVFGGQLERVTVDGDASFDLSLTIPLRDWANFDFAARIQSNDGFLQIDGFQPPVSDLNGFVMMDRESVSSEALSGQFLGRPIAIELQPAPDSMPGYRLMANATGAASATGLSEGFDLPLGYLDGDTQFNAKLFFPRAGQNEPVPFRIEVESDLSGMAVDLPVPLGKDRDAAIAVAGSIVLHAADEKIVTNGSAGELLAWQSDFIKVEDRWDFDRGALSVGGDDIVPAETRGLHITGRTELVRLQDWLDLSKGDGDKIGVVDRIRSIELSVDDLFLLGQHVVDHQVRVDRSGEDWAVQIDGEHFSGSAIIPYEFSSERVLTLDMERMLLPGDETIAEDEPARVVDPRSLPSIALKTKELALGNRFFGAVEGNFQRTPAGLVATDLKATDETFEITGEASWIADATDPSGYRSAISASLVSTNIEATMQRLNYEPGIEGDDLNIYFGLSWSGSPREEFMDSLNGEVKVALGVGQLVEVDPGAGRVFGLMSIGALPRRLSLDFSDVFNQGFGFDEIKGDFRLENGDAYTCNLSLAGPAADIGIVGYASLVDREYGQTAVVSANVGNTLPIVGAVIAGPQVAAALIIFSQIFKKPLQDMGQVYYSIDGSWDEPTIDSTNAQSFAERGRDAGCIAK
jgi:uncharacterized protein (TIGR02099 family)